MPACCANRLKGINPEEIDLKGLQMTHFGIKPRVNYKASVKKLANIRHCGRQPASALPRVVTGSAPSSPN